jgi:heme oxygenase
MYRRLKASLAPHPLRYLGQRHLQGPTWPEMLALLRTQLPTGADQARACRGAVVAFELLMLQFQRAKVLA